MDLRQSADWPLAASGQERDPSSLQICSNRSCEMVKNRRASLPPSCPPQRDETAETASCPQTWKKWLRLIKKHLAESLIGVQNYSLSTCPGAPPGRWRGTVGSASFWEAARLLSEARPAYGCDDWLGEPKPHTGAAEEAGDKTCSLADFKSAAKLKKTHRNQSLQVFFTS